MAAAIGLDDKAVYYADLATKIKQAFADQFVSDDGIIQGDAQSCYALALHYGIYPEEMEAQFEKRMMDKFIPYDGCMNTGFHSTLPLMKELVKRGYADKAFQLLETTEFPSWGYSIEQGATSIWERWDGYVKGRGMQGAGMNSFNHYAFGAVGEWMYKHILGIQPDENHPGFTHFILKPLPGGTLTWARGGYHAITGKIEAEWKKEGHVLTYHISVPANTTAQVHLPGKGPETATMNGQPLSDAIKASDIAYQDGHTVFLVRSGNYEFETEL
jgi:alpha-L-rhamnosidase